MGARLGVQFVGPHILERLGVLALRIIAPTTLALAQTPPVGGGQRSTVMTLPIHIGLDQNRADSVARLPIVGHLPQHRTVRLSGQIGDSQLGPKQKAGQPDDLGPVLAAGGAVPADPLVPAFQMVGRRTKADGTHKARVALHQIAQLRPEERTAAQRVLPDDEPIPNPVGRILLILDEAHAQAGDGFAGPRQRRQRGQGLSVVAQAAGLGAWSRRSRRRQLHQASLF